MVNAQHDYLVLVVIDLVHDSERPAPSDPAALQFPTKRLADSLWDGEQITGDQIEHGRSDLLG